MEFEFNPDKSISNKLKHGIDFIEAQALWKDKERLEIPSQFDSEQRSLLIGCIAEKYWTAVYTMRSPHTRIISVRCSRKNEIKLYEC